ncbi:protein wingless [Planococcus citri]|uniref:protein wingless n=1 Tax=Planococcus citri TaxID=170843 RepID=UPI0031FA293B
MWSRVLRVAMLTALWGLGDLQVTTTVKPGRGKGSNWWGIAKAGEPNNLLPMTPGMVRHSLDPNTMYNFRKKQKRLVRENAGVLEAISRGAKLAIDECQYQFKNHQWNCSTTNYFKGKNIFGKIVDKGCRETAFIYAITSAAVTHTVARACAESSIVSCNCDYNYKSRRSSFSTNVVVGARDWQWDGCSDNIGFGYKFAREFVDAGEKGRNSREKMNLHNNEAGRSHVVSQMRQECKCHGMSGSCTTRTCWMRLPNFRIIGDHLKDRFDGASQVQSTETNNENSKRTITRRKRNRHRAHLQPLSPEYKPPSLMDLVYLEDSPKFCLWNPRLGILGTKGRICNETSLGMDGCDLMCCGRGHRTQEIMVRERCGCSFQWCCEVKCNICNNKKSVHTCK